MCHQQYALFLPSGSLIDDIKRCAAYNSASTPTNRSSGNACEKFEMLVSAVRSDIRSCAERTARRENGSSERSA